MPQQSDFDVPMKVRVIHVDRHTNEMGLAMFIPGWMTRPMEIGTIALIYEAANRHVRRTLNRRAKP